MPTEKVFILYQERQYTYDAHTLVPRHRRQAEPTRHVHFYPATTEQLGKIMNYVHPGFDAWLVPAQGDVQHFQPADILDTCAALIRAGGIARKIA